MAPEPLRQRVLAAINALPEQATLQQVVVALVLTAQEGGVPKHEPELWKLDVNDRYQAAVGVITSLSTAAMVLPIVLLRDVLGRNSGQSIAGFLNLPVVVAWVSLAVAVLSAILYYYSSAKWVKLAWLGKADMFHRTVSASTVEHLLDRSYFLMMLGFIVGVAMMLYFAVTFVR